MSVAAFTGRIDDVKMVDDWGNTVPGVLTPDKTGWHPTEQLSYARSYTMTVSRPRARRHAVASDVELHHPVARLRDHRQPQHHRRLLARRRQHLRRRHRRHGATSTIPIIDKIAAEKRLRVTSNPPVAGSWNWIDDHEAHWRPEKYCAPDTSVDVTADIYGVNLGDGMYGDENQHVSFKIGNSHVSIADDTNKQVSVFDNGKLIRTMPTSMGKGGTQTVGGRDLHFWTPPGIYTVLDKANSVVMDSTTYGLPSGSGGYRDDRPVRHPNQRGRHLPAPAEFDRVGAGQHQRVPRLSQPQR